MRIGVAGWAIPGAERDAFPAEGSALQRYASRFSGVEINTSFYRPHRPQTYARWAASVPRDFRFAVKAPRALTHEARLRDAAPGLEAFLAQAGELGPTLGPILIQLPPSLNFEAAVVEAFLGAFRRLHAGDAVLEPRHRSWFDAPADDTLRAFRIGRVAADPAPDPRGAEPGGWSGLGYWRLHGSPQMYHTPYGEDRLRAYAERLGADNWCVFDNTASGAAVPDALRLQRLLGR